MTWLLILFLGAVIAASWLWLRWRSPLPKYPPLAVNIHDSQMQNAIQEAKARIAEFRQLLAQEHKQADIKFAVITSTGETEHVWAEVLEVQGDQLQVRVNTPPISHIGRFERVWQKPFDDIEDWQIILSDQIIVGGFTMRVMFQKAREQWGNLPDELAELEKRYR